MNDLWNDIRFLSGAPDPGCRAPGTGRAAEIALAEGCGEAARAVIALRPTTYGWTGKGRASRSV